jgi:hypothetical protein
MRRLQPQCGQPPANVAMELCGHLTAFFVPLAKQVDRQGF